MEDERIGLELDWFRKITSSPGKVLEEWISGGKRAAGCFPYYAPEELVWAAGFLPMALWGGSLQAGKAKTWCPPYICSLVQTSLELGARGGYRGLSAVVCAPICDTLRSLTQNWQAASDIPLLSYSQPQNRASLEGQVFLSGEYRELYERLCCLNGRESDPGEVLKAISLYREKDRLRREFTRLADRLLPSERSFVLKAAGFSAPDEYILHLKRLNPLLRQLPEPGPADIPVMTTGILCDHPKLLAELDRLHFRIVADDIAAESRSFSHPVPEGETDPFLALAKRFAAVDADSLLIPGGMPAQTSLKGREESLVQLAKISGARAVLLLREQFCDPEELLEVPLRAAMEKAGIPFLCLPVDQQMSDPGQAVPLLETLADLLEGTG